MRSPTPITTFIGTRFANRFANPSYSKELTREPLSSLRSRLHQHSAL